uniref:Ubiquitin-like domain-containing protein n=1 Tax=Borely moumouvirus TaxID=2712067 RepID=A0A6G6AC75_9VIRU
MENDIKEIFVFHKSKFYSIDVDFNTKVMDLKEKIYKFTYLSPNYQKIGVVSDKNNLKDGQKFFIISDVDDSRTLYDIGFSYGDRIYVINKNLFN